MIHFTEWLSHTWLSLAIQTHEWIIPTIQSIHIVAIGVVLASVFMIDLRVLGWAGRDQSLLETTARFGPWLSGSLCVLLATGIFMIIGEPGREFLVEDTFVRLPGIGGDDEPIHCRGCAHVSGGDGALRGHIEETFFAGGQRHYAQTGP